MDHNQETTNDNSFYSDSDVESIIPLEGFLATSSSQHITSNFFTPSNIASSSNEITHVCLF